MTDSTGIEEIIKQYDPMIRSIVRNRFIYGYSTDDLVQEGRMALLKAIKMYNNSKGPFGSFVRMCVMRWINTLLKHNMRLKRKHNITIYSLETLYEEFCPSECPIEDYVEEITLQEYWHRLNSLLKDRDFLTTLEMEISRGILNGESYVAIAQKINCGLKAIDNAYRRVKRKLKRQLQVEGLLCCM